MLTNRPLADFEKVALKLKTKEVLELRTIIYKQQLTITILENERIPPSRLLFNKCRAYLIKKRWIKEKPWKPIERRKGWY